MVSRREIKGSIVISTTGLMVTAFILYIFNISLDQLQIEKESNVYFAITLALIAFMELFMIVLVGDILEYNRKQPELLSLILPAIIMLILAYYLDMFVDNVKTAISLGTILGVALYTLIASE